MKNRANKRERRTDLELLEANRPADRGDSEVREALLRGRACEGVVREPQLRARRGVRLENDAKDGGEVCLHLIPGQPPVAVSVEEVKGGAHRGDVPLAADHGEASDERGEGGDGTADDFEERGSKV